MKQYSTLVGLIREYQEKHLIEEAIELAIDDCIKNGVLSEYLTKCRNEAISMAFTTFDKERYEQVMKEDYMELGYEKGIEKGIQEGKKIAMVAMASLIKAGKINVMDAADALGVSAEMINEHLQ